MRNSHRARLHVKAAARSHGKPAMFALAFVACAAHDVNAIPAAWGAP